jgi:hypothetical protein
MPLDLMTRLDPLRRVRCPFCFERFAAFELHLRCDNPACEADYAHMIDDPILSRALNGSAVGPGGTGSVLRSAWWVDPRADVRRGVRRHLDWFLMPAALRCATCGRPTDRHLCPRCHQWLPDSAITRPGGHITIFGPQSVGKTTYMTVLLEEMDQRVGPERGLILEPLTEEIRERYKLEYRDVTYGSSQLGVGEEAVGDHSRHSHFPTPSVELNRRVLQPLIYVVKRREGRKPQPLLSFSDMAGEDWEMKVPLLRREGGHLIREARGLLFIIDPLRIPEVARDTRLDLTDKERMVPAADYREDLSRLASFFRRTPVRTPLAICLNKIDRWGPLLAPETTLYQVARSVPDQPPDRRVDQLVHEEVQSALRRWDQLSFLEHLAIDFPNHRFFACSALGDAAQSREDMPQPLPTPLLVERAVLWLLQQQGIIKG